MRIPEEERPHFSASQLTTYLQCPLMYYYQYELGIPWKATPSAVAFGGSIHRAIETVNRELMDNGISKDEAVSAFNKDWTANLEENEIAWGKPEESAELLDKGQTLVGLYYDHFRDSKPEAVELKFRIPILDPTTGLFVESRDLVGKIDAVVDNGIAEIKSTGRTPNQQEIDANLQITLYSLAYRFLYGTPEGKIQLVALIKTKEPKLEVVETHRDELDHTRLVMLTAQIIDCIDRKLFYPNPIGGYGCSSCHYQNECRKWGEKK